MQRQVDRNVSPSSGLRASIVGENRLDLILSALALVCALMGALVWAWLGGLLLDLSPLIRERVFWVVLAISTALLTATSMRNAIGELAIEWARKEETAKRYLHSLHRLFEDLNLELEHSVPDLERFSNHDLFGPSPLVDAALKGIRLSDRSPLKPARREPTLLRRS